jgi:hypothetical protein
MSIEKLKIDYKAQKKKPGTIHKLTTIKGAVNPA